MGPLAVAGISAGIGLGKDYVNTLLQRKQNKENQDFTWKQMQQTRDWSNEDWNRENHYNAPAQQIQRLREAGLNPALMYGHGVEASSKVKATPTPTPSTQAPQIDFNTREVLQAVGQNQDNKNLESQRRLIQQQTELVLAQEMKTLTDTKGAEVQLKQARELYDTTIAKSKADLEAVNTTIDSTNQSITESKARVDKIAADIANTESDTRLKELHEELRAQGMEPGDNALVKLISRWMSNPGEIPKQFKWIAKYF